MYIISLHVCIHIYIYIYCGASVWEAFIRNRQNTAPVDKPRRHDSPTARPGTGSNWGRGLILAMMLVVSVDNSGKAALLIEASLSAAGSKAS